MAAGSRAIQKPPVRRLDSWSARTPYRWRCEYRGAPARNSEFRAGTPLSSAYPMRCVASPMTTREIQIDQRVRTCCRILPCRGVRLSEGAELKSALIRKRAAFYLRSYAYGKRVCVCMQSISLSTWYHGGGRRLGSGLRLWLDLSDNTYLYNLVICIIRWR